MRSLAEHPCLAEHRPVPCGAEARAQARAQARYIITCAAAPHTPPTTSTENPQPERAYSRTGHTLEGRGRASLPWPCILVGAVAVHPCRGRASLSEQSVHSLPGCSLASGERDHTASPTSELAPTSRWCQLGCRGPLSPRAQVSPGTFSVSLRTRHSSLFSRVWSDYCEVGA